jgi:exosome complex RNA-binding protein Rrp4
MVGGGEAVVPGALLGSTNEFAAGDGTFLRNETVFSSVVGWTQVSATNQKGENSAPEQEKVLFPA